MKYPSRLIDRIGARIGDRIMDLVYFLFEVRDRPWRQK